MNGMLPLKDIKGLMEISDYSVYYFLALAFLSLMAIIAFAYFLYHIFLYYKNKKLNLKNLLKKITSLKLDNSKQFSYKWTKYNNQIQDEFKALKINKYANILNDMSVFSNSLELYKYKAKSDELDDDTKNNFTKLKERINAISI